MPSPGLVTFLTFTASKLHTAANDSPFAGKLLAVGRTAFVDFDSAAGDGGLRASVIKTSSAPTSSPLPSDWSQANDIGLDSLHRNRNVLWKKETEVLWFRIQVQKERTSKMCSTGSIFSDGGTTAEPKTGPHRANFWSLRNNHPIFSTTEELELLDQVFKYTVLKKRTR